MSGQTSTKNPLRALPPPGARPSAAGTSCFTRVRPWGEKHTPAEEQALPIELPCHLCDPTGPRAEDHPDAGATSYRRGGFHKEGEGPSFGGSLVTFCPIRKSPQRSASPPGWQACTRIEKADNSSVCPMGFHLSLRESQGGLAFFLEICYDIK